MAEIVKTWDNGGSLSVVFTGDGDGTAVISSTENEGAEREAELRFIDASRSVIAVRRVVQAMKQGDIDYPDDPNAEYFALAGEVSICRFKFSNSIQYSFDKINWIELPADTWSEEFGLNFIKEEKSTVFLKGKFKPKPQEGIGTFSIDGTISIYGNIMSLLFGGQCDSHRDLTGYDYAFYKLFYGCGISVISDYTIGRYIDTLSPYCFAYAFYGSVLYYFYPFGMPMAPYCFYNTYAYAYIDVDTIPTIPNIPLAPHCFDGMFASSSLTGVFIESEGLADGCFNNAFAGCENLNRIEFFSLQAPSEQYCLNWVDGVSESGTFIKSDDAEWDDAYGVSAIPEGWDVYRESDAPGGLFSYIVALPSGDNVISKDEYSDEYDGVLDFGMVLAKETFLPIRNPFFIVMHEEEGIMPWVSQYIMVDEEYAYCNMVILPYESPPYIGLLYEAIIAVDGNMVEDDSFVFEDISEYDYDTGEVHVAFLIYTNGVRVSENSTIYGLDDTQYYILDITDDYIIFALYNFYDLYTLLEQGFLGFELSTE